MVEPGAHGAGKARTASPRYVVVLRTLAASVGPVGPGGYYAFAERAWPAATVHATVPLGSARRSGYARTAGQLLAKCGRMGLAEYCSSRGGWTITAAGRRAAGIHRERVTDVEHH